MSFMQTSMGEFLRRNIILPAIDFVYSPICFYCRGLVQSGMYLCNECDSWLEQIPYETDLHASLRNEVLSHCQTLLDVYALYEFVPGGVLQTLIHDLKYQQKTTVGIDLGRRLGEAVRAFFGVDDSWIVIPIPLHPSRERERGYNQSYYIAAGIREVTGAPVADKAVHRIRNTRTQTKLTTPERKNNVTSAFVCIDKREILSNRNIAIVDDVITTGATIAEVSRILPKNANIYAFSLAHTSTNT